MGQTESETTLCVCPSYSTITINVFQKTISNILANALLLLAGLGLWVCYGLGSAMGVLWVGFGNGRDMDWVRAMGVLWVEFGNGRAMGWVRAMGVLWAEGEAWV